MNEIGAASALVPKIGILGSVAGTAGFIGAIWVTIKYPALAIASIAAAVPIALVFRSTPAENPFCFLACIIAASLIASKKTRKEKKSAENTTTPAGRHRVEEQSTLSRSGRHCAAE